MVSDHPSRASYTAGRLSNDLNHSPREATDLVLTTYSLEIFLKISTRDGESVGSELSQCGASGHPGEWSIFLQMNKHVRLNGNVQN